MINQFAIIKDVTWCIGIRGLRCFDLQKSPFILSKGKLIRSQLSGMSPCAFEPEVYDTLNFKSDYSSYQKGKNFHLSISKAPFFGLIYPVTFLCFSKQFLTAPSLK